MPCFGVIGLVDPFDLGLLLHALLTEYQWVRTGRLRETEANDPSSAVPGPLNEKIYPRNSDDHEGYVLSMLNIEDSRIFSKFNSTVQFLEFTL